MPDPTAPTKCPDLGCEPDVERTIYRSLIAVDRNHYGPRISGFLIHLVGYRVSKWSPFEPTHGARYSTLNQLADTAGLEGDERKKFRHAVRRCARQLGLTEQMAYWILKGVSEGREVRGLPDAPKVYRGNRS